MKIKTIAKILFILLVGVFLFNLTNTTYAAVKCPQLQQGDLVQFGDSNAVYIINQDSKRLYFPNSEVYHTWFGDFNSVNEVEADCASEFESPSTLPSGINYRPGSALVKSLFSSKVYAVTPDNVARPIENEQIASDLYGEDWSKEVRDIPLEFWTNYKKGKAITSTKPHDGMLLQTEGSNVVYKVIDGKTYEVIGAVPVIAQSDIQQVSESVFNSIENTDQAITSDSVIRNPMDDSEISKFDKVEDIDSTDSTTQPPDLSINKINDLVHQLINQKRTENNLSSLDQNDTVADVSLDHSKDMGEKNYFSHTSQDGTTAKERVLPTCKDLGYRGFGENLYSGYIYSTVTYTNQDVSYDWKTEQEIADQAVTGWMNSPGHRENVLGDFDIEGIGTYITPDHRIYITENFCG